MNISNSHLKYLSNKCQIKIRILLFVFNPKTSHLRFFIFPRHFIQVTFVFLVIVFLNKLNDFLNFKDKTIISSIKYKVNILFYTYLKCYNIKCFNGNVHSTIYTNIYIYYFYFNNFFFILKIIFFSF